MTVLIISRRTAEADGQLAAAAESLGWRTFVADAEPEFRGLRRTEAVLYGRVEDVEDWAERLGVTLLSPEPDALVRLPEEYRLRDVRMTTLAELGEVRDLPERVFLKPAGPTGKDFDAGVYGDGRDIVGPGDPRRLPRSMTVLAAEPVEWRIEYRCFVLDRRVTTLAPYLRGVRTVQLPDGRWPPAPEAEAAEVLGFAGRVLADGRCDVPEAVVMDVGYIEGRGWAVVEFNPAWCSTLYGCRPADALPVLRRACRPLPAGPGR